jgi:Tol biopolymer transport system component
MAIWRLALSIFAAALTTSAAAADGFPLKKLASFTFLVDYEPFWSPDSRQIVVVSNRHGGMKLHVMNADSAPATAATCASSR